MRSLESYDRSTWMEREEISYKRLLDEDTWVLHLGVEGRRPVGMQPLLRWPRFTEGLLDEAETWVTKNFEDMQSALEPAAGT